MYTRKTYNQSVCAFYFVKRNLGKNFPFCRNSFRVRVLRFISYYSISTVHIQPAINTSRQPHSQKKSLRI